MISWILNTLFQFSSVTQLGLTLRNPMDCIMPGFPVLYHLLELAQIHVHQVSDAIQPSHPLSSPSPPAFSLSYIRVFFSESVSASVLPMNIQDWFPLGLAGLISLQSKWFSKVFSNTIVQKGQFFVTQLYLYSNCHIIHDYWENHSFD